MVASFIATSRITFSWTEIETRIKELKQRDLEHHRTSRDGPLDAVQFHNDDGTNPRWGFLGSSKDIRADTERLFSIAGNKLESSRLAASPRLQREKDDLSRWLWFLVEVGNHKKHVTTTSVHNGKQVETHSRWLHQVLDEALAGCVEAMKRELTGKS